jgi:hypothetical protein
MVIVAFLERSGLDQFHGYIGYLLFGHQRKDDVKVQFIIGQYRLMVVVLGRGFQVDINQLTGMFLYKSAGILGLGNISAQTEKVPCVQLQEHI